MTSVSYCRIMTCSTTPETSPESSPSAPSDIPTGAEINRLGRALAGEGLAAHEAELERIARLADRTGTVRAAAGVLRDRTANETVRLRAFATIAQAWSRIRPAAARWSAFDREFDRLAEQATAHHELRRSGGALADLLDSRLALDGMRADVAIRRATLV